MKNTMQRYNKSCKLQGFYIKNIVYLNFIKSFAIPFKLPLQ